MIGTLNSANYFLNKDQIMTDNRTPFYYLHTNGSLIYKPHVDVADLEESDFVVEYWAWNEDRETLWSILIEGLGLSTSVEVTIREVAELAPIWLCDLRDLTEYMVRELPNEVRATGVMYFLRDVLKIDPREWMDWFASTPVGSEPNYETMPKAKK